MHGEWCVGVKSYGITELFKARMICKARMPIVSARRLPHVFQHSFAALLFSSLLLPVASGRSDKSVGVDGDRRGERLSVHCGHTFNLLDQTTAADGIAKE